MRSFAFLAPALVAGCTFLSGVDGYRTAPTSIDEDSGAATEGDSGDAGAVSSDDGAAACFTLTVTAAVPVKINAGGQDVPVPYAACLGAGTPVRIEKAQGPGDVDFSACPAAPLRAKRCAFAMPANDVTIDVK